MDTQGIEDRLDDVGIGILASPYLAKGLGGIAGRMGLPGVQNAANAYEHAFHSTPWGEVAGLGLVAPGVIKPMAHGIAKTLDKEEVAKVAYVQGTRDTLLRLGL